MSEQPRVLYVAYGGAGERITAAVERADVAPIEATGGLDALKRLEYERVAAIVVPAELPDVPTRLFVARADATSAAGPCIVVGDVNVAPVPVIQLDSDVTVPALAERIERAIRDRWVGDAFERHDRLTHALVRVAGAIAAEPIERVLRDALEDVGGYRFVSVGRCDLDAGTIDLDRPFPARVAWSDVGDLLGEPASSSVRRAIETGTVTQVPLESHSDLHVPPGGGAADRGDPVLTTVPLADSDRTIGVAFLVSEADDAPDGSERTLLARIGRLCGLALGRDPGGGRARDGGSESIAAADVEGAVEVDVHEAALDVWRDVRTAGAELVIAEPTAVEADRAQFERLLSDVFRATIEHAGPAAPVRIGALPVGGGFFVEGGGPPIESEERPSAPDGVAVTTAAESSVGLELAREVATAHDWVVSVIGGDPDDPIRIEVRTTVGSTRRRDELSALFDEGAGEFVFGETRGAE